MARVTIITSGLGSVALLAVSDCASFTLVSQERFRVVSETALALNGGVFAVVTRHDVVTVETSLRAFSADLSVSIPKLSFGAGSRFTNELSGISEIFFEFVSRHALGAVLFSV